MIEKFKSLAEIEQAHIVAALDHFKGNKTRAADALGISLKTLYSKLHTYDLFEQYRKIASQRRYGV